MGKLGVQETKDVLTLVIDAANIVSEAHKNDGKIDLADAGLLLKLVPDLGPALSGISSIPSELADLDEAEATEIVTFVMSKYSLGDEHAKELIAAGLKAVAAAWSLIQVIRK